MEMGACPCAVSIALLIIPAIISMVLVNTAVIQATKVPHVHKVNEKYDKLEKTMYFQKAFYESYNISCVKSPSLIKLNLYMIFF